MRGVSGFLVLALASGVVSAQGNAGSTVIVLAGSTDSLGCPVGFSAERRSTTEIRYAKDGKQLRGQGLELKFDSQPKKILKANVTVRGVNGAARMMPAGSASADDVAEIFQLGVAAGEDSLRHSSIWTERVATVRWVDLTEVSYADGSVWHASQGTRCRVEPSKFLLVAGAK